MKAATDSTSKTFHVGELCTNGHEPVLFLLHAVYIINTLRVIMKKSCHDCKNPVYLPTTQHIQYSSCFMQYTIYTRSCVMVNKKSCHKWKNPVHGQHQYPSCFCQYTIYIRSCVSNLPALCSIQKIRGHV